MTQPTAEFACSLTAPATPENLDRVHDLIDQFCLSQPELSERDRIRLVGAVVELASNIVEHAATALGHEHVTFELVLSAYPDRVTASVSDDGRAADLDLSGVSMPGWEAESGRGLALARAMTDELSYHRDGQSNRWHLTWCRDS